MRIALFITCLADALYPDVGKATVRLLERLGHEVDFPQAQTCCGQMHINTGYQPEALPLVRHFVETFEPYEAIVAPSGSCVGSVRHQHAMVARGQGDEALARRAEAVAERTYELSELLVDVLGVDGRGRLLPAPRHLPPHLPLAADAAGGRQAAAAAAQRPRHDPAGAAGRGPVLRVRRHVRAQERRDVDGDAGRQDEERARHGRGGAHGRRQLLPDAHRRRTEAGCAAGRRPCTWPRSWRARTPGPRRGRPRVHGGGVHDAPASACRAIAPRGVGHLRGDHARSRRPPAPRCRTRSCAATSGTPRAMIRDEARERRRRARRLGGAAARRRGDEDARRWPGSTSTWSGWSARSPPAAAWCTGRATPTRPTRSSPGWCRRPARPRSSRSSRWPPRRSGSTRRSRRPGITAYETDLAELIVQLGHDMPSHILVPAIHRNRAEIREIFLREMPDVDPSLTAEPRRLAMAARAHLRKRFLRAKVAISGANFGVAETGTLLVVESEGNGRMCLTLPETLITVMGIEKVVPELAGPGGVPAAAAALVDRRADEPLHLGVDGRDPRRRAAGVPPRAARQRAHGDARPTRSAATRCTASGARPA